MDQPVESTGIRAGSPEEDPGESSAPDEGRRPVPVRRAMEGVEEGNGEDQQERRVIRVPGGGEEWTITVIGRSGSGVLPTRTIPLLELAFTPGADPDAPPRTVLCRGDSLSQVSDAELLAHLSSLLRPRRGQRTR